MKYLPIYLMFFITSITCLVQADAEPLTAREIMEKVDARDDGDNLIFDSEMILIDKRKHRRIRKLKFFVKDRGDDVLRVQFFLSPADVRNTGFLTYDYYSIEKDDDQWIFLPELHKTKRIASSDKSQSFMGSDFSYADMNRRVLDEWKYTLLKEGVVKKNKVWIIEALPVSGEVADRYGYLKSVIFIRQDIFYPVRAVHWLKKGNKIKYMEVKKLELKDDIWVGTETHIKTTKNKKTLHRTILKWSNIRFNQDIDEDVFTIRRLEKGL
jgi:hypothetical protein